MYNLPKLPNVREYVFIDNSDIRYQSDTLNIRISHFYAGYTDSTGVIVGWENPSFTIAVL